MSSDRNIDRHELYAVEGGGDPSADGRGMLERARAAVRAAFSHDPGQEGQYGHLAPVPSLPEEEAGQEEPAETGVTEAAQAAAADPDSNVTLITQAPSHQAEGEVDSRYKAIREARLKVEAETAAMPAPDISQLEDLFK